MKRFFYPGMLVALFALCAATPVKKSNLSILYVGGSADWQTADTAELHRYVRDRVAAFKTMLEGYFTSVTVIDAADYKQELSYHHDVTVIDGTPPPVRPAVREYDANGRLTRIVPAAYLTEEFDRPVLFIGELGEKIGRAIGLKTDWYCLCLDADAHHLRLEHPVFHGPFPVKLTTRVKPTPEDAFHYAYYADGPIPDSLPMWQVQTKGYLTDDNFRIGMVARPWGFEDSPDAEYISSGVCAKTLDAVAIGRHGNFLHWGFAASPAYLTDEAKSVLANAIVYIARFAGQGVIARKYNDRIATREYLKELKYLSTRESYEERVKSEEEFREDMQATKQKLKEKQERGEKLLPNEAQLLSVNPAPFSLTFEEYVKRYQKDFFHLFGTDTKAYHDFYDANRDYFYGEGFYHIEVDEDVKGLGIPNNDHRLLDAAIRLWETGSDVDKARRILARYTLVDFPAAEEWRTWYETNKDRLFFTEPGGWLFLVNSREPGANDYHARDARRAIAAITAGETSDRSPVSVTTGVIDGVPGTRELVVKINIHPGYHLYGNVAQGDPYTPTAIAFDLPPGYSLAGELLLPPVHPFTSNGTTILEDEVVYRQPIRGTGPGEAKCTLEYQCCDAHVCFPPAREELTVKL